MKVKTYKYESLQEGLDKIKSDLGGDALILSTRSVSVRPRFRLFKKAAWEITAAVQDDKPHAEPKTSPIAPPSPKPAAAAAPAINRGK